MKNQKQTYKGVLLLACLFIITSSIYATDGYFSAGYGTINKGFAGAGSAYYKTALVNGNPAGLAFLDNSVQLGLAIFNPNRQYTVTGNPSMRLGAFGLTPGTVESDSKVFAIPSAGINYRLNETTAIAGAFFGNGGMKTDYPTNTFHSPSIKETGVNLTQMFANVSVAKELIENHSIGLTASLVYQLFEAKGLENFAGFSSNRTKLTDNDSDNALGFGFKVGYMGHLTDMLAVAASFQPKIAMEAFDEYSGLFAEQGDFDVPATWNAGIALNATDDVLIVADVKQIFYSDIKSINNPMLPNLFEAGWDVPNTLLGNAGGAGFGWEDMTVYKVGIQYSGLDCWELRGGFSYGENPIPESEVMFNILAPGLIESHIALGASRALGDSGKMLDLSFNYALNNSVSGANPLEAPGQQTIEIEMNQMEFEVGFRF